MVEIQMKALTTAVLAATIFACSALGQSQTTRPVASQVIGEVIALDAQLRQISIRTDQGEAVTVAIGDSTTFRKVPAGAQNLTKAARIVLADVGAGDRIVAIGER